MTTVQMTEKTKTTTPAVSVEQIRQVAGKHNEPDWLIKQRLQAWDIYLEAPMPDRVRHLWRYTDPEQFLLATDNIIGPDCETEDDIGRDMEKIFEHKHHAAELICQNGCIVLRQVNPELEKKGVIITDLHTAAREHPKLVEPYLGKEVHPGHGKFEALNSALWQSGLFVYIPRGLVIEKPIHLVTTGNGHPEFLGTRLLVVVDENAQATIVDESTGNPPAPMAVNGVVELKLNQAANVQYVNIQRWKENVKTHVTQRANVERDAKLFSVWAGLGSGVVKSDIGARLVGKGAESRLQGMVFARNKQHFDYHTVHDHRSGESYSDLDMKVVLRDKARSVYTGLIRIDKNARICEAYQENRNLLLNDNTRADTIPELEILNDEVKCSHGATIGPIDEDMVFYLAARGIPRDEAVRMIVAGFVEPTLAAMPEDLRERLQESVMNRLQQI
jgi:Fe-S cluster assembly protein SufD